MNIINMAVFFELIAAIYVLIFIVSWIAKMKPLAFLFAFLAGYYYRRSMKADNEYFQVIDSIQEPFNERSDTGKKDNEGED